MQKKLLYVSANMQKTKDKVKATVESEIVVMKAKRKFVIFYRCIRIILGLQKILG